MEQTSNEKSRNFFIRTYLTEEDVRGFIKTLSVAKWAYIKHDERDGKEPHFHIVLRLNNPTTLSSMRGKIKAFGRGKDNGKDVNSDVQECIDLNDAFLYLTHESNSAVSAGKALYDVKDVRTNDFGYFRGDYSSAGKKIKAEKCAENTAYQILCDMERGISLRDMARRYGREFIINFNRYNEFYALIKHEENPNVAWGEELASLRVKKLEEELEFQRAILGKKIAVIEMLDQENKRLKDEQLTIKE